MEVTLSLNLSAPTNTILTRRRRRKISQHQLLSKFTISRAFRFPPHPPIVRVTEGRHNFSQRRLSHLLKNPTYRVSCSQVKVEGDIDDEACELVNGAELILGEGEDTFCSYLFKAVKNNNGIGILLLSDVHGFEASSTRDFAYRVACNGYNVLVPDLFRGKPWNKARPRSEFDDWVLAQPFERVVKDIKMSAKWMIDEFEAAGICNKLGILGFCFGGGCLIQALAEDQGTYFSTAVCFYGTHMDQSLASKINIPVLFISGDSDPLCSISTLRDLEKSISRGSEVAVFEGRGHAFVHRPGSAEEDRDADQAFVLLRNWLQDGLNVNKAE